MNGRRCNWVRTQDPLVADGSLVADTLPSSIDHGWYCEILHSLSKFDILLENHAIEGHCVTKTCLETSNERIWMPVGI